MEGPPIEGIKPEEDAGSLTYHRFRVQASMALPYVLGVILSQVGRVIMEHIDDFLVLNMDGTVELHQVKTRDDGGRWTIASLTTSSTHGRPLYRILARFRLVRHLPSQHFLHLQGPMDNDVRRLAAHCESQDVESEVSEVAGRLACDAAEARDLLLRTKIRNDVPHQDLVMDVCMNRYIFPRASSRLNADEAVTVARNMLDRIGRAMEAEPVVPATSWLDDLLAGRPPADPVSRKTIDRESLSEFVDVFRAGQRNLLASALPSSVWTSALTEKLRAGHADDSLLQQAQTLRASAYQKHVEELTGGSSAEAELADVYTRVMTAVLEVLGDIPERPARASRLFSGLSRLLRNEAPNIDPARVFLGDSNLLLGAAFHLCDECRWRLD